MENKTLTDYNFKFYFRLVRAPIIIFLSFITLNYVIIYFSELISPSKFIQIFYSFSNLFVNGIFFIPSLSILVFPSYIGYRASKKFGCNFSQIILSSLFFSTTLSIINFLYSFIFLFLPILYSQNNYSSDDIGASIILLFNLPAISIFNYILPSLILSITFGLIAKFIIKIERKTKQTEIVKQIEEEKKYKNKKQKIIHFFIGSLYFLIPINLFAFNKYFTNNLTLGITIISLLLIFLILLIYFFSKKRYLFWGLVASPLLSVIYTFFIMLFYFIIKDAIN